jgi:hypothetical protein
MCSALDRKLCLVKKIFLRDQVLLKRKVRRSDYDSETSTISMQILETKTHVQFIQLHMTRLQIFFRQRMKKHKHDVLIKDFCRQIKHCLFETRKRRRRKTKKTSIARKIKWTQAMHIKLFADERENVIFSNRIFIKFFLKKWRNMWSAYQTKNRRKLCETLISDITSKKIKLYKNLIKSKSSFVIHIKTRRIKLIDYFFFIVYSSYLHRNAFVNIQNKR